MPRETRLLAAAGTSFTRSWRDPPNPWVGPISADPSRQSGSDYIRVGEGEKERDSVYPRCTSHGSVSGGSEPGMRPRCDPQALEHHPAIRTIARIRSFTGTDGRGKRRPTGTSPFEPGRLANPGFHRVGLRCCL